MSKDKNLLYRLERSGDLVLSSQGDEAGANLSAIDRVWSELDVETPAIRKAASALNLHEDEIGEMLIKGIQVEWSTPIVLK